MVPYPVALTNYEVALKEMTPEKLARLLLSCGCGDCPLREECEDADEVVSNEPCISKVVEYYNKTWVMSVKEMDDMLSILMRGDDGNEK